MSIDSTPEATTEADVQPTPSPLARPHLIGLAALLLAMFLIAVTAFAVSRDDDPASDTKGQTNVAQVWERLEPSTRVFLCEQDEATRMALARSAAEKSGQTEADALGMVALMQKVC